MTQEQKEWIDNASYEQLLHRWRFAPIGDPMFQGEVGEYYRKAIIARKHADPKGAAQASKNIGW